MIQYEILCSFQTPGGADYVLVTNPPTGYPLLYGDKVIFIDNNYIDLTHIDLSTIIRSYVMNKIK